MIYIPLLLIFKREIIIIISSAFFLMIYLFLGFLINIYIFLQWCLYFSLLLIIKYESSLLALLFFPLSKNVTFFSLSLVSFVGLFSFHLLFYIYWNRLNLLLHIPDLKLSLNFSHIFFSLSSVEISKKKNRERESK